MAEHRKFSVLGLFFTSFCVQVAFSFVVFLFLFSFLFFEPLFRPGAILFARFGCPVQPQCRDLGFVLRF